MSAFFAACIAIVLAAPQPDVATVTRDDVPIRFAADEKSEVAAVVAKGTVLKVVSIAGVWVQVRTEAGVTGFVLRRDLVPGKKVFEKAPPPKPAATPAPRPSPVAEPAVPAPDIPVDGPRGRRPRQTGLLVHAGPVMATSSYRLTGGSSSRHSGTRFVGVGADAEYWMFDFLGARLALASARGSTSTRVSASTSVTGISSELRSAQVELLGRWRIGRSAGAPSVVGGLGFRMQEVIVESVEIGGASVGPVSRRYAGVTAGLGGEMPLGGPRTGVHARAEYWLAPSVTEPDDASGTPDQASGLGFRAGGYSHVTRRIRVDATIESLSFETRFQGTGVRYDEAVRDARATERQTTFRVSGAVRF